VRLRSSTESGGKRPLPFGSKGPEIERISRVFGARPKVLTRLHIKGRPAFSCKCVLGEVLTNWIGTPLAAGGSTRDSIAGSGRKKPKRTSMYPSDGLRGLSSGMSIVLGSSGTRKMNFYSVQGNLRNLIQGGPRATGSSRSCGQAEIVAVGGIDR